jgi:hypothetical protein
MDYKIWQGVAEERTQPRNLAELRHYLRMEYGLGTEPGFLLRDVAEETESPRDRVRRAFRKIVRMVTGVGAPATGNGRRPRGGATKPTR